MHPEAGTFQPYFAPEKPEGKPRMLGQWNETLKAYRIVRFEAVHLLRKHDSYGIQATIIKDLAARGCKTIILNERRKNTDSWWTYEIPFHLWLRGREVRLNNKDGLQIHLGLRRLPPGTRLSTAPEGP